MKSSILIALLKDGSMHSVASPTFAPINELAVKIRKDRSIVIDKQVVPVIKAVVISQNGVSASVEKVIRCEVERAREVLTAETAKKTETAKKKK